MARKKNTIPSGFENILGNIYSNAEQGEGVSNVDDILPPNTPLEEIEEETVPAKGAEESNEDEVIIEEPKNDTDDSDIPQDVLDKMNNVEVNKTHESEEDDDEQLTNADLIEAQQIGLLFEAVGESLGWDMSSIKDEDKPLTVDGLTEYLTEAVRQNSIPEYADERIQKLDEYVKNGGKFEDFYTVQKDNLTLESIDMEDESNQKIVIRELLKHEGYTDDQINKRITRYEDADMLYEESEDALDRLKLIKKQKAEEVAEQQRLYAEQQEQASREFFNSVSTDINNLTDIRGISIPKEDRKALFEYIFKVDSNGQSQYQKDFNKNLSKNLIESAYFTMKADALISNAKKTGETSATEKLRKLLRHTQKNHSTYNIDQEKQKSVVDLASGLF